MGLKGYWKLNGNSNDYSGNGNNGTDTNITYSQSNGRLNQGAGFGGSSKILIGNSTSISGTGSHTISLWVNMASLPSSNYASMFFVKGRKDNSQGCWGFFIRAENISGTTLLKTSVVTTSPSVAMYTVNGPAPTIGTWYHLVAVFDNLAKTLTLFVNGVKYGSSVSTGSTLRYGYSTGCAIGYFGSAGTSQYYLNGKIDEVILDNTAWTPAQIKNEYARTKGFF